MSDQGNTTQRVLVTGGTGFLGEHLVRTLDRANQRARVQGRADAFDIRVMARSKSPVIAELGISLTRGDIMTGGELARTLEGCDAIFHLAGLVSRDPADSQRMMRLHVDGTRRVLRAAAAAGVKRVIVASTSGTVAVSDQPEILDERAGHATELVAGWPYYVSKIYQEKLAFELGLELGLEIVCVNPSLLLGPGDRRLSSTNDVLRFMRREIPTVPEGGINFVDARDAARATMMALTRGRPGERYLLGGPNWTVEEFFGRLARASKVNAPRIKLPERFSRAGAGLIEHLYRWREREPPIDRMSVEMGYHYWWCDSSKAEAELEFSARDPGLTLGDTVRYLRANVDPSTLPAAPRT